jgi:hypothetical protein
LSQLRTNLRPQPGFLIFSIKKQLFLSQSRCNLAPRPGFLESKDSAFSKSQRLFLSQPRCNFTPRPGFLKFFISPMENGSQRRERRDPKTEDHPEEKETPYLYPVGQPLPPEGLLNRNVDLCPNDGDYPFD